MSSDNSNVFLKIDQDKCRVKMLKYPVFCIWIIRQRTDWATNDQYLFFFICNM